MRTLLIVAILATPSFGQFRRPFSPQDFFRQFERTFGEQANEPDPPQPPPQQEPDLVDQGKDIFENETFGGNGRTCSNCHRGPRFALDLPVVAQVPDSDPLFVAEGNADLPVWDPDDPDTPAFEAPKSLIRSRGLILQNPNDGPQVLRAVPGLLNLAWTAPYGASGSAADLRSQTQLAIRQHMTKSMNREPGVDFRWAVRAELDALEAYMLSLTSHNTYDIDTIINNLGWTNPQMQWALDGRQDFVNVGCTVCHSTQVLSGGFHATGVESFNLSLPRDPGIGTHELPRFDTPQLFGLGFREGKQNFFHNNTFAKMQEAVRFYTTDQFEEASGLTIDMTDEQIRDIAYFLVGLGIIRHDLPEP